MSTLSGSVSKGEKSKPKFQVLDINSLYRHSRGENTEKTTQKSSSVNIRHGMQSLGKVPNARRAPANLPSLKSEHSGSDAAVPLVPPGAPPGWGKQDATSPGSSTAPSSTTPPATSTNTAAPSSSAIPPSHQQSHIHPHHHQQQVTQQQQQHQQQQQQQQMVHQQQLPPQLTPHQVAIAIPVSPNAPLPHGGKQMPPSVQPAGGSDKLWSTVMSGHQNHTDGQPPLYQSPQFQHEFPSLSAGDGGQTRAATDTQYVSGLSLRPQTEGSWTQGGQRPAGHEGGAVGGGGPQRAGSAGLGGPPQLSVQVGREPPQAPFPPQIRGVMPPFMYKGSFPQGAPVGPNLGNTQQQTGGASVNNGRGGGGGRPSMDNRPPRLSDRDKDGGVDELSHRPIIKEEELSKLDEIAQDMGWAASDDIDYNEKLGFSDEESDHKKDGMRSQNRDRQTPPRQSSWNTGRSARGRSSDEEDMRIQRRTQQEVDLAVQRAKQRKEEEEKRFQEEKARAAKKLSQLNEKITREKRDRNRESEVGTMNPMLVPPKPINHVEIPLPDFQKDKDERENAPRERDSRSRTPNEPKEESNFRQLTQIEGKNFPSRKQQSNQQNQQGHQQQQQKSERDHRDVREQNGPSFSRHFQNDMPPRFQRQQRNNSGNVVHHQQQQQQQSYHPYDNNRWSMVNNNQPNSASKSNLDDDDRREYKRQSSDESYRSHHSGQDNVNNQKSSQESRYDDRHHHRHSFQEEDVGGNKNWQKEKVQHQQQQQPHQQHQDNKKDYERMYSEDRRSQEKTITHERERPPRTDSRDSFSRRSRDSEPRDYMSSWNESVEMQCYEEKRREERRQVPALVPGPITKDRIEAEDVSGEKRNNLTQLKRGEAAAAKRQAEAAVKKDDDSVVATNEKFGSGAWADSIPALEEFEAVEKMQQEKAKDQQQQQQNVESKHQHQQDSNKITHHHNQQHHHQPHHQQNDTKKDDYHNKDNNRHNNSGNKGGSCRGYQSQNSGGSGRGWGGPPSSDYHSRNSSWGNKRSSSRGHKPSGGGGRSVDNRDFFGHGTTDSDGSADTHSIDSKDNTKSSHKTKFGDKDEKNRENKLEQVSSSEVKVEKHDNPKKDSTYVPRGEPSRHGRGGGGGGSFRGSNRMGGMSKRIDGYGPPPSKSPFGHPSEERDKKAVSSSTEESCSMATNENVAAPVVDKTKLNQEALAAGIIGKNRIDSQPEDANKNKIGGIKSANSKPEQHKNKPRSKDDNNESNSENSDGKEGTTRRAPPSSGSIGSSGSNKSSSSGRPPGRENMTSMRGRNNAPPRLSGDKRYENVPKKSSNEMSNSIDAAQRNIVKEDLLDDKDEKLSEVNGDFEGFQEVKSKKNVKERSQTKSVIADDKKPLASANKAVTDNKDSAINKMDPTNIRVDRNKGISSSGMPAAIGGNKSTVSVVTQQLTALQIQNIPSLMATPVNPPPVLPQPKSSVGGSGNQFEMRQNRQNKLAPRFAKQKAQMQQQRQHHQQQQGIMNPEDMSKSLNVYGGVNDITSPVGGCAWDKPLASQLRAAEHENVLGVTIETMKLEQVQSTVQGTSPNADKMLPKSPQLQDKTLLDGSTPPVNTIIFENTNFKSAPGPRAATVNKQPRIGVDVMVDENGVLKSIKMQPGMDLLQNKTSVDSNTNKNDPIQLPALFKEDTSDMKLDFFGSDLTHLTDDKSSKTLCMSKTMQNSTSMTICNADSLNMKIASVKKVWETSEQETDENVAPGTNMTAFGGPTLDAAGAFKGSDPQDDGHHEGYSPGPGPTASASTNVCKVKPTQQVSGSGGQVVSSSVGQQQHSSMVPHVLLGTPLSPPPTIPPVLGANVGLGPQQYTASQHLGYQTGHGSTQYGISAIPSPPTVLYNSTQQLQAAAQSAGLYGAFQIDQSGVLGGQGRSQYSQYPSYHSLGQAASSPYSAQSVYLPTAPPPHPPPAAQAPPEIYPNINSYRLSAATAQFGQSQQLNNPTTVLISSTSNSLMSASVKPSSQPISAIGTKAGGVGQAYQQQSQQSQQVYMTYDPTIQANYLSNPGVMQRGPAGPVQNSVVPTLQPSSSYYSGSTGGQTGYFQQPASSTLQSAQLQQHQAGYGLQTNVFGTHSQSHTNTALQGYNSHFLSTAMPVASAISAQFRSGLPTQYMKSVGSQQLAGDQSARQQEILSSVFTSAPQIPSPKSRQNTKHPPPQSSPTSQRKYNLYQNVGNQQQQSNLQQRYPTPIQRPVNFQQQNLSCGSVQQNNSANQKHRNNANKTPNNRQYYGGQTNSLSSQNDKVEDSKLNDSGSNTSVKVTGTSVTSNSEIVKENIKEETNTLKD